MIPGGDQCVIVAQPALYSYTVTPEELPYASGGFGLGSGHDAEGIRSF